MSTDAILNLTPSDRLSISPALLLSLPPTAPIAGGGGGTSAPTSVGAFSYLLLADILRGDKKDLPDNPLAEMLRDMLGM